MFPNIEPLGRHHDRAAFSCGVEDLDDYLKTRAGQDERRNVARVFVATGRLPSDIAGYYTISSIGIDVGELPDDKARVLPRYRDIPAALIGRLVVGADYQGRGLGKLLLVDALKRIAEYSEGIGIYAVVVEAKNRSAAAFYEKYGFIRFVGSAHRLFLPIRTIRRSFE
ncbi:MAG: GNAT family N-acetyltransferase [Alphaproteobacteria bacterium]